MFTHLIIYENLVTSLKKIQFWSACFLKNIFYLHYFWIKGYLSFKNFNANENKYENNRQIDKTK